MNDRCDYQQSLEGLRYTPAQKAQLAERALRAAKQENRRARRPVRRLGLAAAALVAVLAVGTAGATGVLKSAVDSFSGIFGAGPAQTEIIDKIGRPIGASDTAEGLTITADAIIGDPYNAAIVYTIRRDDGTPLLPQGAENQMLLVGGTGGADLNLRGGSHGSARFVDETPGDDVIQLVQTISADIPIPGSTASASFDGLFVWDEEQGERVPVVEGRWEFRFDVNYEDASVVLGGGETFQQGGMSFTVDEITVSPVAVRAAYTVDSAVQWSDAPSGRQSDEDSRSVQRYLENVSILLTKTDGTVLDLSGAGGSISPKDGVTVCAKGGVLDEIVPLEELESISVGGIVYSIHGN